MMRAFKKFIYYYFPRAVALYHFALAFGGAVWYGFPGRKLYVVGVTGTKGKTTTCNLIAHVLNRAGLKAGLVTTVNFGIGDARWENTTRQTMPGRFRLQKLLRQMAAAGCRFAVIETSSEGILQYRHRFVAYRAAVFTNLMPEHLDRHGGFENYRAAKLKLFEQVARRKDGVGVYNLDDANVEYFLRPPIAKKYGFTLKVSSFPACARASAGRQLPTSNIMMVRNVRLSPEGSSFDCGGEAFTMPLLGSFNVQNAAAAIAFARAQGVSWNAIRAALAASPRVPGRLEVVDNGQPFTVVIDYAYDPNGLQAALAAMKIFKLARLIVLTGIAAVNRDRWQREAMGEVAANAADIIIVTTDDPGDEDPNTTIDAVVAGALKSTKYALGKNVFKVVDRREAIARALSLARKGDAVLLAGKGGETAMKVAGGKKIPWSDRTVVEELLKLQETP